MFARRCTWSDTFTVLWDVVASCTNPSTSEWCWKPWLCLESCPRCVVASLQTGVGHCMCKSHSGRNRESTVMSCDSHMTWSCSPVLSHIPLPLPPVEWCSECLDPLQVADGRLRGTGRWGGKQFFLILRFIRLTYFYWKENKQRQWSCL